MARWALVLSILGTTGVASAVSPCRDVDCGAGVCITEKEQAYCFCDEGYSAHELTCLPAASTDRRDRAGWDIVRLAKAEVGRDLSTVGRYRRAYPGRLSRYVPEGGLWCSDFVSWVYRSAGAPLTGGYEGGWLVTNNKAMRSWFERRGLWVDKTDRGFRTFDPRPGDYVRIVGNRWGHSAIVERVEGTTLHLIEGNAGNRVRAVQYRNFRRHRRVDGFGIASFTRLRRRRFGVPPRWLFAVPRW